jgi:D-xylonolactonase
VKKIVGGLGLLEGPTWHEGTLLFSDVTMGGVYRLSQDGDVTQVVAKRRGIGGMAVHRDGSLIVSGRDVSHIGLSGQGGGVLLGADITDTAIGFNDMCVDKAGRLYVGSLNYNVFNGEAARPGDLFMLGLDGSVRKVSDGLLLTNGLGFSPDGRKLYHSDAGAKRVRVYEVDDDGGLGPWRTLCQFDGIGFPDGLKVAVDGSVWVAVAHEGRVAIYSADGAAIGQITVPQPIVTSLCFGGDDMQTLYIVAGAPSEAGHGAVYTSRTDVKGLKRFKAEVPLSTK